jgi:hypothetical protein
MVKGNWEAGSAILVTLDLPTNRGIRSAVGQPDQEPREAE